jgi:hypothetical protein
MKSHGVIACNVVRPISIPQKNCSPIAGRIFDTALTKILPNLKTEIVKRSYQANGFAPLPKALDHRTSNRLAQPLPPTGQGIGAISIARRAIYCAPGAIFLMSAMWSTRITASSLA